MLYMNYPRCGDCVFSASFVEECNDVSCVAGEGVGLTVHKESVDIEEIEEVELISRRAQFIYERNYDRNAHAPSRHPVKKLKDVLTKEKSKSICTEGYQEKYHFLLFLRIHN